MSDHNKRAINILPFGGKAPMAESHRPKRDTKCTAQVWQRLWMMGPTELAHGRAARMTKIGGDSSRRSRPPGTQSS
jgi:hypothetical protein